MLTIPVVIVEMAIKRVDEKIAGSVARRSATIGIGEAEHRNDTNRNRRRKMENVGKVSLDYSLKEPGVYAPSGSRNFF